MRLIITSRGWEDHESWTGERQTLQRLSTMIDQEHRLVHGVVDGDLVVVLARGHH